MPQQNLHRIGFAVMLAVFLLPLLPGCVRHIHPYEPKFRQYEPRVQPPPRVLQSTDGSLWMPDSSGNNLYSDIRARRVSDIITVRIEEIATAERDAGTSLGRKSSIDAKVDAMLGFMKALEEANPNFDKSAMLSASFDNSFEGSGKTTRNDKLLATIPAQIMKVLPNGDYFIEGRRVVLLNNEEHHLYVSGVVRPSDVNADNTVPSTRIADAQIEFVGRGAISEKLTPGWLGRILDQVWPF